MSSEALLASQPEQFVGARCRALRLDLASVAGRRVLGAVRRALGLRQPGSR